MLCCVTLHYLQLFSRVLTEERKCEENGAGSRRGRKVGEERGVLERCQQLSSWFKMLRELKVCPSVNETKLWGVSGHFKDSHIQGARLPYDFPFPWKMYEGASGLDFLDPERLTDFRSEQCAEAPVGMIREILIALWVQRQWTLEGARAEIQADICPSTVSNSQDGSSHADRQILKA